LLELPLWKRASSEQLRKLRQQTVEQTSRPLVKELEREFASNLGVLKYLSSVKGHLVEAILEVLVDENSERDDKESRKMMEERFLPNLLFAREPGSGAPVIYEQNPTYPNLFGSIDFANIQGAVYTSYRHVRPGALHKANGGYLLLEADKLLSQPQVWQKLKLALKTQELSIEHPYAELSQSGLYTLQPEKIPLNVKVVLLGDPEIYYTLQEYDQEFTELFRILADFDRTIEKSPQSIAAYTALIRQRALKNHYPKVCDEAARLLVRYALRRAEHQQKLSANIVQVNDLLDEAYYIWLKEQQSDVCSHLKDVGILLDEDDDSAPELKASHVQQALEAKQQRTGRLSETWLEEIKECQVLISTQGQAVGKINGLTVLEIGDSLFGTPARISATVYAGANGVTDIEREAELGKSIHSKGVLLLTGYLGHKYGQNFTLSISANIAIEQSYGHIDGDSASLAELCALISAITQLPIRQSLAITGSINQHGQVQSIGGVNEKIEGFFRLCRDKGLDGSHGVIIPRSNQLNLMLSDEVIEAVAQRMFTIYVVDNVDQTLELLMEAKAGEINSKGRYPRKSIHALAMDKLAYFSKLLHGEED
jgi:lon-related putative ATP-dependent protease